MNRGQIRTDIRRRVDETGRAVFFTDEDIDNAIDDAMDEIADATEYHEEMMTLNLLDRRPWYDLRYVFGDRFLALGPTFNVTTNQWMIPSSSRDLDNRDRRWEINIGQPQRVMSYSLWWLGFWPLAQGVVGSLLQYVVSLPAHMTSDTDVPQFPAVYHKAVTEHALSDLFMMDGEATLSWQSWKAYLEQETLIRNWVDQRARVPRLGGLGAEIP